MNGVALAFIGYLLFNAISSAYHAGKGDFKLRLTSRELKINATIYAVLAAFVLVLQ